jgi:hypothetical protein
MGMDLLPPGEARRRAVRWVREQKASGSPRADLQLVDEASRRFNLGPAEEEFLFRLLHAPVERPRAVRPRGAPQE